jgi:hypothetical protein
MSFKSIAGRKTYGKITQAADTVITRLVEPRKNVFTHITALAYTAAGTAHTLTIMRPLNKTTFTAAAAAAQAVVNIAADPGVYTGSRTANNVIAANDYVVYEAADGTFVLTTVSSVSTLAITLAANLPTGGVLQGGTMWFYGITTDTNPNDAQAHPQHTLTASVTTVLGNDPGEAAGSVCSSLPPSKIPAVSTLLCNGKGDPLIVHSNNATAAGTLENVFVVYAN